MKPKRNRYFCPDCGRVKMLFVSKKKAQGFIKWNAKHIWQGNHLRPYFCPACCGWHISHLEYSEEYEGRTDQLIELYRKEYKDKKARRHIDKLLIGNVNS